MNKFDVKKIDKNTYNKSFLTSLYSEKKHPIVIYGVSRTGLMALCGFENISVKVDYFIDDDVSKSDKNYYGLLLVERSVLYVRLQSVTQ